jgi:uncharacterized membrane protein YfcA
VAGPALFAIDPNFAPGPLLMAAQLVNLRHIYAELDHIDRTAFTNSLKGLPIGLGGGLVVLSLLSDRTMGLLVGGLTATAAITLMTGAQVRRTNSSDVAGGAACTFAGVTSGLPGPPLVIAFHDMNPRQMRGTSAAFMLSVAAIGFVALAATGNFGKKELELTLWLIPGVLLGLYIARWVRPLIDRPWFRPLILVVALIGGLALVVRNL